MKSPIKSSLWRDLLIMALLGFILLIWRLGDQPFYPSDESLHVKATQSMLHGGDLLIPTVDGDPYIKKPPFKMWLSLIPLSILGESAFSYRITDAVAAALTLLITYLLSRSMFPGNLAALAAVLALFGCRYFIFYHCARNAVQDSMLVMLSTAIMWLGWRLIQGSKTVLIIGIIAACALLTKNIAGLMPLIFLAAGLLGTGQLVDVVRRNKANVILAVILASIIPALYLFSVYLRAPQLFSSEMNGEIVQRFSEGMHNREDFWFYWRGIFLLNGAVQPILLGCAFFFALAMALRKDKRFIYLLAWSLLPLIVMSLLQSRMPWYISIAFPAMSILVGGLVSAFNSSSVIQRGALAIIFLLLGFNVAQNVTEIAQPLNHPSWRQKNIFEIRRPSLRSALAAWLNGDRVPEISAVVLNKAVRKLSSQGINTQVLLYKLPPLAQHESIYIDALSTRRIKSTDEIKATLAENPNALIITPLDDADEVRAIIKPSQFLSLPPENRFSRFNWHRRRSALIAFSTLANQKLNGFKDFNRAFDIASESLPIIYGVHGIEKMDAVTFRRSRGPRAAFELSGDIYYMIRPTELTLIMGLLPHTKAGIECQVTAYLNEVMLGTKIVSSREIGEYKFPIPAFSWNSSRNILTLAIRHGDGTMPEPSEQILLLDNLAINLP